MVYPKPSNGVIAQLARALALQARGCGIVLH